MELGCCGEEEVEEAVVDWAHYRISQEPGESWQFTWSLSPPCPAPQHQSDILFMIRQLTSASVYSVVGPPILLGHSNTKLHNKLGVSPPLAPALPNYLAMISLLSEGNV